MGIVVYHISPGVTNRELNELFDVSWPGHAQSNFTPVLDRSLLYACAYRDGCLVGFVNVAWDGGRHAFILDTTVHPGQRRQGIGVELVQRAAAAAKERGIEWLHVDFEPGLREFYRRCGFVSTAAGLMTAGDRR